MPVLSNNPGDCEVLNLDPAHGRGGPFVVVQTAIDSKDPGQHERMFILRRDGVWSDCASLTLLALDDAQCACFASMRDVGEVLGKLAAEPSIDRRDVSKTQLETVLRESEAAGGMLAAIRAAVARRKAGPTA